VDIQIPDIGDFRNVPVIEVHVAPGDVVAAEDPLITLESDKATMNIPVPVAGTMAYRAAATEPEGQVARHRVRSQSKPTGLAWPAGVWVAGH
jgi:pyruvate/2-oxoglutarate dehydrogenase complex dihydrolipoamide acyltransferase (E2) component